MDQQATRSRSVRWGVLLLTAAAVGGTLWLGLSRLEVETDIASSIPDSGRVLSDARKVMSRGAAMDKVAVHLSLESAKEADPDRLVAAAEMVGRRLAQSGLFSRVGLGLDGAAGSKLYGLILDHLPALFSERQLLDEVAPLLEEAAVQRALKSALDQLAQLEGTGQAEAMAKDPLDLRRRVLQRLTRLLPAGKIQVYRNQLLSADRRHLLLVATPSKPGSDSENARKLHRLFVDIKEEFSKASRPDPGAGVRLAVVGGFRAALDNETMARADTQRAMVIATVGIALLLLFCFPRPLLGLLALLPAVAGLAMALLVTSLIRPGISALALGFGGALVSITVDHGIAYLLLLDRTEATSGRRAARDLWSVGLFAALTTVGAFSVLGLSGFAILEQVGLVAGLGVAFSFLFVHTVFPLVFPSLPAARRGSLLPAQRWVMWLTGGRSWIGPSLAGLLLVGLGMFARPQFAMDIAAMNSVSPETRADELRLGKTWQGFFDRVYLLAEAPDRDGLRRRCDQSADFVEGEATRQTLTGGIAPSTVLPGPDRARQNRAAWRGFWTPARRAQLQANLARAGEALGFADDAFVPFWQSLNLTTASAVSIPVQLYDMMGISRSNAGGWVWLGTFNRGPNYQAEAVAQRAGKAGLAVFDPRRFTGHLSSHISDTFLRMLGFITAAVTALLLLLFLDVTLVLLTLTPLLFAMVCTLGTLNLLGRPIDIPGLMLVIVVFGMGVDYALFLVRSRQRFLDDDHPSLAPIRLAVMLAAGSTLVGMGSLLFARHAVPRSAGITAALGVGYALLGALLILPPLLRRLFGRPQVEPAPEAGREPSQVAARVRRRYRHLDPYARLFARFKMRLDPMFPSLTRRLELDTDAPRLLDVGCGLSVPAAWLLETVPGLRIVASDQDPDRVSLARRVLGDRAEVRCLSAPRLPESAEPFDVALVLDMAHHLSPSDLRSLFDGIHRRLRPGGRLLIRVTVPTDKERPWERWLERIHARLGGRDITFHSAAVIERTLRDARFGAVETEPTAPGREETWFAARAEHTDRANP